MPLLRIKFIYTLLHDVNQNKFIYVWFRTFRLCYYIVQCTLDNNTRTIHTPQKRHSKLKRWSVWSTCLFWISHLNSPRNMGRGRKIKLEFFVFQNLLAVFFCTAARNHENSQNANKSMKWSPIDLKCKRAAGFIYNVNNTTFWAQYRQNRYSNVRNMANIFHAIK